jgi:hypothetical protein
MTPELWRWGERKIKWEVGRRENFWGKEEVEKPIIPSREDVFLVHPQNDLTTSS